MDVREARANIARILGNAALISGLAVALGAAAYYDGLPVTPYFFAALLVNIGVGLRLEAAILYRR
ncbi:hypothetical protein [Actinoplanes sp. NPDC049802]|uniref:hypothetical protein n=1 Tax=Actinoplanes sp. NPDC049802 TaxID=3154742 RepID=UPI0033F5E801